MPTDSSELARVQPAAAVPPSRRRLFLATLLAGIWVISLAMLSICTAHPVTLNVRQIRQSTDVLTVVVENPQDGTVRVQKSWLRRIEVGSLRLKNLSAAGAVKGPQYLVPVSRLDGDWFVTPTPLPRRPLLIYSLNAESEQQLESILKTDRWP